MSITLAISLSDSQVMKILIKVAQRVLRQPSVFIEKLLAVRFLNKVAKSKSAKR